MPSSYPPMSIAFHWASAFLVILMLILGYVMDTPELYFFHKSFGLVVLILTVLRLLWIRQHPRYPTDMSAIEKAAAYFVKYAMYLCLLLMPITGWIFSSAGGRPATFFGLFTVSAPTALNPLAHFSHETHEILPFVLIALIALHVLAALKHHYINKDTIFLRMIGK